MFLTMLRRAAAWAYVSAAPAKVEYDAGFNHAAGELLRGNSPGKPDASPFGQGMAAACTLWHNTQAMTATKGHVNALRSVHEARFRTLLDQHLTANPSFG